MDEGLERVKEMNRKPKHEGNGEKTSPMRELEKWEDLFREVHEIFRNWDV